MFAIKAINQTPCWLSKRITKIYIGNPEFTVHIYQEKKSILQYTEIKSHIFFSPFSITDKVPFTSAVFRIFR